jgi:hypothetical protein
MDKNVMAWRSKFKEVLLRARSAFSNDPKMISEIERFEKQYKTSIISLLACRFMLLSTTMKIVTCIILFYIILALIPHNSSSPPSIEENIAHEKTRLEQVLQECQNAIQTEDFLQAEMLTNQLRWEYEPNNSYYSKEIDNQKEVWNEKRNNLLGIINKLNKPNKKK